MIILPACLTCKHFTHGSIENPPMRCAAFPDGIPKPIASGEHRHEEPFPGDRGIRYERVEVHFHQYEHPTWERVAKDAGFEYVREVR